jgi:hypothetical protein
MSAKIVSCGAVLAVLLAWPAGVLASPGAGSIASSDGSSIYMASPASPAGDSTIVAKIRGSDRKSVATVRLPGAFRVPVVAGVAGGLAHDGKTLVLDGRPAAGSTRFAILDARTLGVRRMLSLSGRYSFDAMSPDASKLYVIRYLSRDGTHYAVQGLDLTGRRPVAQTLVEKGEPGETLAGQAVTRTSSPDGAWIYTLYDGTEGHPFVHALSTVDEFTVCIDLDALEGRTDIAALGLKLSPESHALAVTAKQGPLALIDTETFEVTERPAMLRQPAAGGPREATAPADRGGRDLPWLVIASCAALAAGTATLARRRLTRTLRVRS